MKPRPVDGWETQKTKSSCYQTPAAVAAPISQSLFLICGCPSRKGTRKGNFDHVVSCLTLPSLGSDAWRRWNTTMFDKTQKSVSVGRRQHRGPPMGSRATKGPRAGQGVKSSSSAPRSAMLILKDPRLLLPRSLVWGLRSTLVRGASAGFASRKKSACIWTGWFDIFDSCARVLMSVVQPARRCCPYDCR